MASSAARCLIDWQLSVTDSTSGLPDGFSARGLSEADAPMLGAIVDACDHTYMEWAPPDWTPLGGETEARDLFKSMKSSKHWMLGASSDAEGLIGFVVVRPMRHDDSGELRDDVGWISDLFVHPRAWRRGIAAFLLSSAERQMADDGRTTGRLLTPVGAPAQAFYMAQGWAPDGTGTFLEMYHMPAIGFSKQIASPDA